MARTRQPQPADAIALADVHLRDTVPECRTDDFLAAMFRKLGAVRDLQERNGGCPVLCAGDVFDHWKPSPWLLAKVIPYIENWVVVPGQHDLPQHSLELYEKSGLAVLERAGCCQVLKEDQWTTVPMSFTVAGIPWGVEPGVWELPSPSVALIHRLIYPGRPPFPGAEKAGGTAKDLLRKMKGFDLIITGDNHQTFVWEEQQGGVILPEGAHQLLVNPGSMMRTTAAQADHEPCVFLWWADGNRIERVPLPFERGVVSREHIDKERARDERIEAFVGRLRDDVEMSLSFRDNLERYIAANEVPDAIAALAWEIVDGPKT